MAFRTPALNQGHRASTQKELSDSDFLGAESRAGKSKDWPQLGGQLHPRPSLPSPLAVKAWPDPLSLVLPGLA